MMAEAVEAMEAMEVTMAADRTATAIRSRHRLLTPSRRPPQATQRTRTHSVSHGTLAISKTSTLTKMYRRWLSKLCGLVVPVPDVSTATRRRRRQRPAGRRAPEMSIAVNSCEMMIAFDPETRVRKYPYPCFNCA